MRKYKPEFTDRELSPYTGLTRKSWMAAAKYLLEGVFDNISDINNPVVMPRTEKEITYPHPDADAGDLEVQKRAEIFEGLTRTLFIASVVMAEDPDITINGINLREYYRLHILRSCTDKASEEYAGSYEDMQELSGRKDMFAPFQQTVETCALVIGLYMCRKVLWETFTRDERDGVAAFLMGFAHANTVPQNWRLFNMLDMAFLYMYGYPIDEKIMADHAIEIMNYYVGDGWYRDGQSFDYYSCWAFNFYAPLWCVWYGYDHMPVIAKRFEEHSNELMVSFPDMFDRDGYTNMWGRSCIYRNAVTSAFDGNMFLGSSGADPGLARRIASGSLLQFMTRDDFLSQGIPSLGFYGQFMPLVQGYSCAESPFWMGKAFLCLHLPETHPFWTAVENNGSWEETAGGEVKETVLDGPALVFTNHRDNGETILRSAKVLKEKGDRHGMWNYSKLNYNTKYPWESSNRDDIESQQYVLKSLTDMHVEEANVTFYAGVRDGVMYRRQLFDHDLSVEYHWQQAVDLADYPMPLGIMRVDRMRICKRPMEITLGAYGFPDNGCTSVTNLAGEKVQISDPVTGSAYSVVPSALILKGKDHMGRDKRMAMTIYSGFDIIKFIYSTGTNPDSKASILPYAVGTLADQYDASEDYIFISQVITLDEDREFTSDEIFPIISIEPDNPLILDNGMPVMGSGCKIRIRHKNGMVKLIDHFGIEGRMML